MSDPGSDPLTESADLLGCPKCGSHRVETFRIDRCIVHTCADCGTHDTEEVR